MDLNQVKDLLPRNVRDMASRIGLPSTLIVVERLGGTTWRIAEGRNPEGEAKRAALADLVGSDIEEQLHREYAGEEIYLARCHAALLRWRNLEIHARFERGVREGRSARDLVAELARDFRLSDRWIWQVLNTYLPAPDQPRLFH